MIYSKAPCGAGDVRDTFFLHVDPADASDLPEHRRRHGFDNLDFRFNGRGGRWLRSAERCAALRELPDYDFVHIRTDQHDDAAPLWVGEFRLDG